MMTPPLKKGNSSHCKGERYRRLNMGSRAKETEAPSKVTSWDTKKRDSKTVKEVTSGPDH